MTPSIPRSSETSQNNSDRAASRIRVLLVSPVRALDIQNGDVSYTEGLIAGASERIDYTTYDDALADGRLVEVNAYRHATSFASRVRSFIPAVENRLRRREWLFREPYRYYNVTPGCFDLIHVHVFSVSLRETTLPLVMSTMLPQHFLYRDAENWARVRLALAVFAEKVLARFHDVQQNTYRLNKIASLVSVSEFCAREYVGQGTVTRDQTQVVSCPVTEPSVTPAPIPGHIGFIARDFDVKGGQLVLDAYRLMRQSRSDISLTIVGSDSRISQEEGRNLNISWLPRVSRDEVLNRILPKLDVFVYPTTFDGLPLIVCEALSLGVPVITSAYGALPEAIGGDAGGIACNDQRPETWAEAISITLEPQRRARLSVAARKLFAERYEARTVGRQLEAVYRSCLADADRLSRDS